MKSVFSKGDIKTYSKIVADSDTATFESGNVHPVYATFALARDAEWACRLFVLEMKESDEEGIGTYVSVRHLGSALPGQEVVFEAKVEELDHNRIYCSYKATCMGRLIAEGEQEQKILKKTKLEKLFEGLK